MRKLILLIAVASICCGQGVRFNNIKVIPNPLQTQVGQIDFLSQNGANAVSLSAPGSISPTVLTISAAADASGVLQCTVSSTASMLSGQSWYVTGITGSGFAPAVYVITVVNMTTFSLNGVTASGSYTTSSATATQNTIWHLPSSDGSSGSVLTTDGIGDLSWSAGSGGSGDISGLSFTSQYWFESLADTTSTTVVNTSSSGNIVTYVSGVLLSKALIGQTVSIISVNYVVSTVASNNLTMTLTTNPGNQTGATLTFSGGLAFKTSTGTSYITGSGNGYFTGNLTINTPYGANNFITQNAVSSGSGVYERFTALQTNGVNRWWIGANSTPETGSNTGSDFFITNYDDSGNVLSTALQIERSTGNTTIPGNVSIGTGSGGGCVYPCPAELSIYGGGILFNRLGSIIAPASPGGANIGTPTLYFGNSYFSGVTLVPTVGTLQWGPSGLASLNTGGGATFTGLITVSAGCSGCTPQALGTGDSPTFANITIGTSGSVSPSSNLGANLGGPSDYFGNGYINTVEVGSALLFGPSLGASLNSGGGATFLSGISGTTLTLSGVTTNSGGQMVCITSGGVLYKTSTIC